MIKRQYRQGDVLIDPVKRATIPPMASSSKDLILAEGEATGHAHRLQAAESGNVDWWKSGQEFYMSVSDPAIVRHEEHGPIPVVEGTYQVIRQREYSPEAIRNVAD